MERARKTNIEFVGLDAEQSPRNPHLHKDIPYSFGTAMFLDGLERYVKATKANVIMINMLTLFRNLHSDNPDATADYIVNKGLEEVGLLLQEISGIMSANGVENQKACVYLFHYFKRIPKEYQRPPTKSREFLIKCTVNALRKMDQMQKHSKVDNIDVTILLRSNAGSGTKDLSTYTHSLQRREQVMMLSHVPLDYHAYKAFKNFVLIYSNTGASVNPRKTNLGTKVYGKSVIPFNKVTHICFGDKDFIKGILTIKQRRMMIDDATKEKWWSKTSDYVIKRISFAGIHVKTKW